MRRKITEKNSDLQIEKG